MRHAQQFGPLADELAVAAGEAFTRRVDTVPALARSSGVLRLAHPEAGTLRLAYETLELSADDDQRLIVQLPADAATSAALDRLDLGRYAGPSAA